MTPISTHMELQVTVVCIVRQNEAFEHRMGRFDETKIAPLSKAIYTALVILLPPRFIPKDFGI